MKRFAVIIILAGILVPSCPPEDKKPFVPKDWCPFGFGRDCGVPK